MPVQVAVVALMSNMTSGSKISDCHFDDPQTGG